jgi:hypothetical protein
MGTSNFNEPDLESEYVAEAILYSGRQNPRWVLSVDLGRHLETIWSGLRPSTAAIATPVGLGYRGCRLTSKRGDTWFAFGGIVQRVHEDLSQVRIDVDHAFERRLLATSPSGLLPLSFLPQELR